MTITSHTNTSLSYPASSIVVLELIDRAREALLDACHVNTAVERHRSAQLGALRAAGALMAAKPSGGKRSVRRDVWATLSAIHPELTEWASFFTITAHRVALAAQERASVSGREADDLLRQVELFLDLVMAQLGLPMMTPLPGCVPIFQRP